MFQNAGQCILPFIIIQHALHCKFLTHAWLWNQCDTLFWVLSWPCGMPPARTVAVPDTLSPFLLSLRWRCEGRDSWTFLPNLCVSEKGKCIWSASLCVYPRPNVLAREYMYICVCVSSVWPDSVILPFQSLMDLFQYWRAVMVARDGLIVMTCRARDNGW